MKYCIKALLGLLVLWPMTAGPAAEAVEVDIEIVLAVDASGSVDRNELLLQLDGIAAAFRDTAVHRAIRQGQHRRIMASMLIWSDAAFSKFPTKWHLLESPASAEKFAQAVEDFRELTTGVSAIGGGGTGLGDGLAYALQMINGNGVEATRRIVDVSGDGRETTPWNKGAIMLPQARDIAATHDVAVNGLAIVLDVPNLDEWYRQNVILGAGSFVMKATDFNDFRRAIRKKLLRELSPPAIGQGTPNGHRSYAAHY